MGPQPPGGAGPDGRCSASDGRCHLPSGHASLPRGRQQSRRARDARGGEARRGSPLPQLLPASGWEGAVSSRNLGCFPSPVPSHASKPRSDPAPPAPSSAQDVSPDPKRSLPAWDLAEPPNAAQQPGCEAGCPAGGVPAPRDPSLLPGGGLWGAGCLHRAGHVPAESPGALRSGEQSPSLTRRLFTGT